MRHQLIIYLLFVVILFTLESSSVAIEDKSTISGRVIFSNEEPITDSSVVLLYVRLMENAGPTLFYENRYYPFLGKETSQQGVQNIATLAEIKELTDPPPYIISTLNTEGKFSLTGVEDGIMQLLVVPNTLLKQDSSPEESIQSTKQELPIIKTIQFGKSLFYPSPIISLPVTGGVTFAISPGTNLENVEIIIKSEYDKQQEIGGKIVFKDGTPLSNKTFIVSKSRLNINGVDGDYANLSIKTDADGSFKFNVNDSGIYALSVHYFGLLAFSELFYLQKNQDRRGLVMRFNGNSSEITIPADKPLKEGTPTYTGRHISYADRFYCPRDWLINPYNGHAYKVVSCDSKREDAVAKAEAADAHLVTITSEEEQIWLDTVFKNFDYWIGLNYVALGKKWEWETGEPFEYSNWLEEDFEEIGTLRGINLPPGVVRPPSFGLKIKEYAIMTRKGQWKALARAWGAQHAIIERDGFRVKKSD